MNPIRVKYCGTDTVHAKDHYYVRSENEDSYLLMFFKTPFAYKKDGKLLTEEKYHYLLNPPYTPAEHGSYRKGFVNDWIFFKGQAAEEILKAFALPQGIPFYIDDNSVIYPYIRKIMLEQSAKPPMYETRISTLIADMLIHLGRQYMLTEKNTHPAFSVINEARNYMLNNFENRVSVRELAVRANYSESRFSTLYSRFFGNSPIEDLLTLRIEKAVSLLVYSQTSVTETAKLCGFSSVHYFSRKFKARMGVSPSSYLTKQK